MRKATLWISLMVALTVLLAACGSDPTATPAQTNTPLPADEPTPTPDPFDAEWAELITAAQAEGTLELFACCTLGGNVKEFEAAGIISLMITFMTLGVALVLRKFGLTVGVRQDMKEKKPAPAADPAPLGARTPQ